MDVLRFITAGSVDDGKSTLIGRLLHDSRSILADQLEALARHSRSADGGIDLALLTDGLRAERAQGITIDVAYRYFSTPRRKFIIADAPGHLQYTPNMITGASNADLAIILVDVRKGVVEQTRRHSIIAALLGIRQIVVAVNKMDLVEYDRSAFEEIVHAYAPVATMAEIRDVRYVPISARHGDNIVERSEKMPWYAGEPLLEILESADVTGDIDLGAGRFPVQYVIRPRAAGASDYRGYAGRVVSGIYRAGDDVTILPSGLHSRVCAIEINGTEVPEAFAPQSVVLRLDDDIDVGRGDMIVPASRPPRVSRDLDALVCWMADRAPAPGDRFLLQLNSRTVTSVIQSIDYRIDVNTLRHEPYDPRSGGRNDIVHARIRASSPVPFDPYRIIRATGSAVLIDEHTNATVGAVMVE